MKIIFYIFFLIFMTLNVSAQEEQVGIEYPEDSTSLIKRKKFFKSGHDPAKAALFSAVIPGAGQIYNKKYWKLPIVYVGLGGLSGLVGYSAIEWRRFTNAYRVEIDDDPFSVGMYKGFTGANRLLIKRRQFKRTLDISAIALGAYYLLQIVDATVDAHLMDFDVNDDISISLLPEFRYQARNNFSYDKSYYAGLRLKVIVK